MKIKSWSSHGAIMMRSDEGLLIQNMLTTSAAGHKMMMVGLMLMGIFIFTFYAQTHHSALQFNINLVPNFSLSAHACVWQ